MNRITMFFNHWGLRVIRTGDQTIGTGHAVPVDHNKLINFVDGSHPASMSFVEDGEGAVKLPTKGHDVMSMNDH
jgi:hypothetical protein